MLRTTQGVCLVANASLIALVGLPGRRICAHAQGGAAGGVRSNLSRTTSTTLPPPRPPPTTLVRTPTPPNPTPSQTMGTGQIDRTISLGEEWAASVAKAVHLRDKQRLKWWTGGVFFTCYKVCVCVWGVGCGVWGVCGGCVGCGVSVWGVGCGVYVGSMWLLRNPTRAVTTSTSSPIHTATTIATTPTRFPPSTSPRPTSPPTHPLLPPPVLPLRRVGIDPNGRQCHVRHVG